MVNIFFVFCMMYDVFFSLYHGWLVDPQTTEVAAAVANMSYNQLVENIIRCNMTVEYRTKDNLYKSC